MQPQANWLFDQEDEWLAGMLQTLPYNQIDDDPNRERYPEGCSPQRTHWNELPQLSDNEVESWTLDEPLTMDDFSRELGEGIDVLAWYQAKSNYGPTWGIYFNLAKMNSHARRIYRVAKGIRPNISPRLVYIIFWDEVTRHELEHFVQELSLSLLIRHGLTSPIDFHAFYSSCSDTIEALATFFQHTDTSYSTSGREPSDQRLVMHLTAIQPKPPGYRDWNRINMNQAQMDSLVPKARALATQIARTRKSARRIIRVAPGTIPVYIV